MQYIAVVGEETAYIITEGPKKRTAGAAGDHRERMLLLPAWGFLGSPSGRGQTRVPGQAGLVEAEGARAAGVRRGGSPHNVAFTATRMALLPSGGEGQTADGTWCRAALRRGEGRGLGKCSLQKGDEWGKTQIEQGAPG